MKLKHVKTDLHTHGLATPGERTKGWKSGLALATEIFPAILERRGKNLAHTNSYLAQNHYGNNLVGIVGFDNCAYPILVNSGNQLPSIYLYDEHKKVFIAVSIPGKRNFNVYLRGQEIPTEQGHVLIIGADRTIPRRNGKFDLGDVLAEAEDLDALRIADHPLAEYGWLGKVFNKFANKTSARYSLGRENLEKYGEHWDSIEVNSNHPELEQETLQIAQELGKPVVYSSDSHDLRNVFSSYMILPELDLTSPEKLRASLREQLKHPQKVELGINGKLETLKHGAIIAWQTARIKAGLLKKIQEEVN